MQKVSKEYLVLFNAITDAENYLRSLQKSLMEAQQQAEELFITSPEDRGVPPTRPPAP